VPEETQRVHTKFTADGKGAEKVTESLARAGERLQHVFSHALGILSVVGGISGAFAIHEAVKDVNDTYNAVNRLRLSLGTSANTADALLSTFKLSGVSLEAAEMVMARMSMKSQHMNDVLTGMSGVQNLITGKFKAMGIALNKGPVEALVSMSKAMKAGKLGLDDLRMLGVGRGMGTSMMEMLARGPEKLRKLIEEQKKAAGAVTDESLQQFLVMRQAQREMGEAWERLVRVVVQKLYPALAPLFVQVTELLKSWVPIVKRFALVLSKALGKFTAFSGRHPGLVGAGVAGMGLQSAGMGLGMGVAGPGSIAVFAGIIAAVRGVAEAWRLNVDGIRERLVDSFGLVTSRVQVFLAIFQKAWGWVDANVLPWLGHTFLEVLESILNTIGTALDGLLSVGFSIRAIYQSIKKGDFDIGMAIARGEQAKLMFLEGLKHPAGGGGPKAGLLPDIDLGKTPTFQQNFINPRFDITQKFAEGYDPDRVSVAFQNDLSMLGERQRQSGFVPLGAVR